MSVATVGVCGAAVPATAVSGVAVDDGVGDIIVIAGDDTGAALVGLGDGLVILL